MGEKQVRTLMTATKKWLKGTRGNRCEFCDSEGVLQVHHTMPLSSGIEDNSLENLRVLCPVCHAIEERRQMTIGSYLEMFLPQAYVQMAALTGMEV